jgi:hypothetical protein
MTSGEEAKLFGDDAVGPFDEADEDGGIAEFGVPGGEVGLGDAAGAGAGSAGEDGDVFGDDFVSEITDGRPADRSGGVGGGFAHEVGGFAEEEDLDFVAGFGEGEAVGEGESGASGVVGAPGGFHEDVERLFGLVGLCTAEGEEWKAGELGEELASGHEWLLRQLKIGLLSVGQTVRRSWKLEKRKWEQEKRRRGKQQIHRVGHAMAQSTSLRSG